MCRNSKILLCTSPLTPVRMTFSSRRCASSSTAEDTVPANRNFRNFHISACLAVHFSFPAFLFLRFSSAISVPLRVSLFPSLSFTALSEA